MVNFKWTIVFLALFISSCMAIEENCDEEKWLPEGSEYTGPGPDECVPYDGSLIPDCGEFITNNVTSYFHVHEYNCSRFWECGPQGPCLFSCAPCGIECGNYDGLVFDCRYQYPQGPVCDFPDNVNCTNGYSTVTHYPTQPTHPTPTTDPGCHTDDDCPSDMWCDTSVNPGECKPGCRTNADCTEMSCSECINHQCVNPECCTNDDCEEVTNMFCSVCNVDTCSRPECCEDDDCEAGFMCEEEKCVPAGECDANRPCDGVNGICVLPTYDNCEYCDLESKQCKPGCDSNSNCPELTPVCQQLGHTCTDGGNTGVTKITVKTATCSQCPGSGNPLGTIEMGLKVSLQGEYGTSCESNGLDNLEVVDYDNGKTAIFDGEPADDGDDDGLGGCKNADLNYGVTGGSAEWTGKGEWTGTSSDTICVDFYDPNNNKPTCCCSLVQSTLGQGESTELTNCSCA